LIKVSVDEGAEEDGGAGESAKLGKTERAKEHRKKIQKL